MLSALKHLIILGDGTKTHEMEDNTTQYTTNAKLNDTQKIKIGRRSRITDRATEGRETPMCY